MADVYQRVSAVGAAVQQLWKEFSGSTYHARVMGAVILNSTGGEVGSTAVPLNIQGAGSTAILGRVDVNSVPGVAVVSTNLTRTTDVTAYSAGDVVSGSTASTGGAYLTFSGVVGSNGGSGLISDAVAVYSANETVKPNLQLYLFTRPVGTTVLVDNGNWIQPTSDMRQCVAEISFAAWSAGGTTTGGNLLSHNQLVRAGFACASTDTALYGVVVERGTTWVGTASARLDFGLKVIRQ